MRIANATSRIWRLLSRILLLAIGVSTGSASAPARTWYVPTEIPTIQGAIDTAATGDTVAVVEGIYYERVAIDHKSIALMGLGSPEDVILSGAQSPTADEPILKLTGLDSASAVLGFTLEEAEAAGEGGAIRCDACSTEIAGNVLRDNQAQSGGAIAVWGDAAPRIVNNRFQGNRATLDGGAIAIYFAGATISGNTFFANTAGDSNSASFGGAILFNAFYDQQPRLVVSHNIFFENEGGYGAAIQVWDGTVTLEGNTFAGNRSNRVEAGRAAIDIYTVVPACLRNNIMSYSENAWGLNIDTGGTAPTLDCNDFWQNQMGDCRGISLGATDITADPHFCSLVLRNLFVAQDSPCLAGNNAECGQIGARGMGCSEPLGFANESPAAAHAAMLIRVRRFGGADRHLTIQLILADDALEGDAEVRIFGPRGQVLDTQLISIHSGSGTATWEEQDRLGRALPSGVYFVEGRLGAYRGTTSFVLLK